MQAWLRSSVFSLFLAGVALGTTPAPGDELGTMTFDNATSSSNCIGNPVTPLCAVETMEACGIRSDKPLCDTVGFDNTDGLVADDYLRLWIFKYELVGSQLLEDSDIPPWAKVLDDKSWKSGDRALRLWWWGCRPEDECVVRTREDPTLEYGEGCSTEKYCGREDIPTTYILRHTGNHWSVVDYYLDPVLPDNYWKRK